MDPYQVKVETLTLGGRDYRIRSLLDRNQYFDPHGEAEARGVSPESWSYFGLVWASGVFLAEAVAATALDGRRVLEVGCGLALGGIVSSHHRADVTASDRHPLAESFLVANLALNTLPPVRYLDLDWTRPPASLGRFDLLLASDVLYLPEHPDELARFIDAHLVPGGDVVVVDPGRRWHTTLSRRLLALGLACVEERPDPGGRTRVLRYHAA